jgi:hypothetical protein
MATIFSSYEGENDLFKKFKLKHHRVIQHNIQNDIINSDEGSLPEIYVESKVNDQDNFKKILYLL